MIASNIASANNHEHPEPHGRSLFRFFLVLTTESSITQMLQEPRRHMRVCKGKAKGGGKQLLHAYASFSGSIGV